MLRILSLAALSAVALLTAPVAAVRAEIVSTGLPTERSIPLRLAAGPAGRAIVLIGGTGSFAERSDSGHWAVRTLPAPGLVPAFPALGPDGAAAMLAVANHAGGGIDAFVLRRSSRGEPFEAPVAVDLGGLVSDNLDGASDARGDIAVMTAVKGPDTVVRGVIATAAAGGPFGAAQVFAPGGAEGAIVAVGAGRVVLTYYRGQGIYGRTGVVGSPLGAPQLRTR
jgi:hypothetical protein